MKVLTALLLLSGIALGLVALRSHAHDRGAVLANGIPRALPAQAEAGQVRHTFSVQGMCCESCPEALFDAVHQVAGVDAIAVDPDKGRVEVDAEPSVSEDALSQALNFDRYVARPVE